MFFEQHGLLPTLKDVILVVTRANIRYRRPTIEGDELRSEDRLKEMTSRHIILTQTIVLSSGKSVAETEIAMMVVNATNRRDISIPAPLSTALKAVAAE